MVRPDVVEYLTGHLAAFPVEDLRRQLLEEGVTENDFQDSLSEALRAPKTVKTESKPIASARMRMILMALTLVVGGIAFVALNERKPAGPSEGNTQNPSGESAFIGHHGWVVRLPKDYIGIADFADKQKTHQIVYFCKKETDPTNLLNEGLYGQLGIVKLEALPSEFPNNPTGLANLARMASAKYTRSGEKFTIKNIQVATLPGIQVNVISPFPRIEAFILGSEDLYFFYGGEEDEVWRDIVLSLRDANTEN